MPKNTRQDKKRVPGKRKPRDSSTRPDMSRAAPQSLDNIMKKQGWLQGLRRARSAQQSWHDWFASELPRELQGAVVNVLQKRHELVVLAGSAAWSARLRFALVDLEARVRERAPDIVKVTVRVSPAGPNPAVPADPS
jgi:hypothetical protein